jgi:MFS family permease
MTKVDERRAGDGAPQSDRIWTRTYILLCVAEFLAYAHQALLTPTLPLFFQHLGASPFLIGLFIASFSVTSILLRPRLGLWADTWNTPGVLRVGALILSASSFLFLIPVIPIAFAVNLLRGIGWAGLNIGGYSLLAQIAPPTRRAEASGYYSSFQSSVSALFPAVALAIIGASFGGFNLVMALAGVFALLGALLSLGISGDRPRSIPTGSAGPKPGDGGSSGIIDRSVLLASVLLLCIILPQPAMTTFIVLYAGELNIGYIGVYFIASGIASILSRPFLGRWADRVGHGPAMATGFSLNVAGVLLLVFARDLVMLAGGGMLYAVGSAIIISATMALAMERADPSRPGRAMATFSTAFQVGAGFGSLIVGTIVQLAGYRSMYVAMIVVVAAGLIITSVNWSNLRSKRHYAEPAPGRPAGETRGAGADD